MLSIGCSGIIYYFTHLYEQWYFFFVPILLIPILYVGIFIVYVLFLYLASLFLNTKKEVKQPKRFWNFFVQQTCFQLLLLTRTRVKVEGKEKIDPTQRYLVVSNHISMFDPIIIMQKLGLHPLIAVSKKENLKFPICGPFIHHAGFIFLDREDTHSAIDMVRKSTDYINQDLASIYICPEGTRSKTQELLPFHPGSFKIATRAEVPIIVCHIDKTHLIAKHFPFRGTKVKIKIVNIISKEDVISKKTTELADIAYEFIKKEKENC